MNYYSTEISNLIEQLSRLPGIGGKSAQRLAFHIIDMPVEQVEKLAETIQNTRKNVKYCTQCYTLTDKEVCPICASAGRDHSTIMVVEDTRDLAAYERTGRFNGVYHVLHGALDPAMGKGPEDIKLKELLVRLQTEPVEELIIATNSDVPGEATAMYISRLLRPMEIKVTRLAYGVPVGSQLEYADEVTLSRALEGRQEI